MKRQLQTVVYGAVLLASLASLSACAPLIVGGAVMTGVVATDRRTAGTLVEDESIEIKVASAVRKEMGERIHLNVTSFNRQVLLSGEVRTAADKERAEKLAQSQENVNSVVNDLAIEPASSLTQRSKDAIITGQVKSEFGDPLDEGVAAHLDASGGADVDAGWAVFQHAGVVDVGSPGTDGSEVGEDVPHLMR
jgi:osmotically-inducible protein OsmY